MFAYLANRSHALRDVLYQERSHIELPPMLRIDACGLSFIHEEEILHIKKRLPDDALFDWIELSGEVKTACAIGHIRTATVGDFRAENTHPFRFRRWIFAHLGTIPAFDEMRTFLHNSLPEFILRNIRGETDSEFLFYLIMSMFHKHGILEVDDPPADQVAQALNDAWSLLSERCQLHDVSLGAQSLLLSNGDSLYAMTREIPIAIRYREGLDSEPPRAVNQEQHKLPDLRYVLLLVGYSPQEGQENITEGILHINRDLQINRLELT